MHQSQLDHLIKMINQIASNNLYNDNVEQAAAKVANHIQRFWAPPMKQQIFNYAASDGSKLSPVVQQAIAQMNP